MYYFTIAMINDQTPITSDILVRNGWEYIAVDGYSFEGIDIEVKEGFACWICYMNGRVGKDFYTIGELKSIAKALYKVELKFE